MKDVTLHVVEDDPDIRETLRNVLECEGYRVVTSCNGARALDALRSGPAPDLILLDLMMPVMDGWSFRRAQLLEPALRHIPVLLLSAGPNLARAASELRVAGVLQKEVRLDELLQTVARMAPSAVLHARS